MRHFRKNKKGFTLIEVIVVVAIIGILSAIATLSVMAVYRNNETKAATTAITNYWKTTARAFNQINLGYSTIKTPNSSFIAAQLGKANGTVTVSTSPCTTLSKGRIHIQYEKDPTNRLNQFTIKRIVINYEGKYYYSDDGKKVRGPKDSMS